MISVIVPAYNVEKYIADCLESITTQSYRDLEIIVVNDGSTDRTLDIINRHAATDPRIRVISQPNGGLSAARNAGLDAATGEWIVFVDGDDMLLPDSLSHLLKITEDTRADIVCGSFIRQNSEPKLTNSKIRCFSGVEAFKNILFQKHIDHSAWGKLYRRSIFDSLRFTTGILYEDLDIAWDVFVPAKKIVCTSRPVYFYRVTPGSILHKFSRRRLDVLTITEKIERRTAELSPELLKAARDRRLSANFNILGLIAANNATKEYQQVCDQAWSVIRTHRRTSLFNSNVRLKNKVGILLSYLGRGLTCRILARHYRG